MIHLSKNSFVFSVALGVFLISSSSFAQVKTTTVETTTQTSPVPPPAAVNPAVTTTTVNTTTVTEVVKAEDMVQAMNNTGRVALYGLYFDTAKAEVKPESKATLDQMARLLTSFPSIKLLVVGHTDNVGEFAANMDLSKRRADSVINALTSQYQIDRQRLTPVGVSFASPTATNATEEGKAKNRRVELVPN